MKVIKFRLSKLKPITDDRLVTSSCYVKAVHGGVHDHIIPTAANPDLEKTPQINYVCAAMKTNNKVAPSVETAEGRRDGGREGGAGRA